VVTKDGGEALTDGPETDERERYASDESLLLFRSRRNRNGAVAAPVTLDYHPAALLIVPFDRRVPPPVWLIRQGRSLALSSGNKHDLQIADFDKDAAIDLAIGTPMVGSPRTT
jgi:hypothetical protein